MRIKIKTVSLLYYIALSIYIAYSSLLTFLNMDTATTIGGRMITACSLGMIIFLIKTVDAKISSHNLLLGIVLFWAYTILCDFIKSAPLKVNIYFLVLVFLIMQSKIKPETVSALIEKTCLLYTILCVVSLIAGMLGFGYDNLYVDTTYLREAARLRGITLHANSLGAYAAVPCIYYVVRSKSKYRFLPIAICAYTLWLTRSKTCIFSLAIIFALYFIDKLVDFLRRINISKIIVLFTLILLLYLLALGSGRGLTGRVGNWQIYLPEYLRSFSSIIIGARVSMHGYFENIFVESLFRYGLVGLILLIVFLVSFSTSAWRMYQKNEKMYFLYFLFFMFRGFTESFIFGSSTNVVSTLFFFILILKEIDMKKQNYNIINNPINDNI